MDEDIKIINVNRVDYMPFPGDGPDGDYMVEKMIDTEEGYLSGRAIATNVGVFPYLLDDGTVQYELRDPKEVFNEDSVNSLANKPITNNHPSVAVLSDNVKDLQVGFTGDVRQDQYHLAPKLTITNKEAVDDVKQGKRALSAGYKCDLEYTSGTWLGIHYDAIQRNIRYNHLAIVEKGRAGDAASMKLDSIESYGIMQTTKKDSLPSNEGDKNKKKRGVSSMKITVDGIEYEVDNSEFVKLYQDTAKELEKIKADKADTGKELEEIKAKADQLKEDLEKVAAEKEELSKVDHSDAIKKAVKEKMDLLLSAEKAEVEVKEDMEDADIKKAVILKVYPNAESKLDGCDEAYLNARFDGAMETLDQETGNSAFVEDTKGTIKKDESLKDGSKNDAERTPEQARQDMIDALKNRSKGKEV